MRLTATESEYVGRDSFEPRPRSNIALLWAAGAVAVLLMAYLSARGSYRETWLTAAALGLFLWFAAGLSSLESLITLWFLASPIASFFCRIPYDRSIVTFNRAALLGAGVILLLGNRKSAQRAIRFSGFETTWMILCGIALANAVTQSNDTGSGLRLAIDSFCLPLLAFHFARHHFDWQRHSRTLVAAGIALALVLVGIGGIEILANTDLFHYTGAEIIRGRERRVNGPFVSDSSYAIISLLLMIFLMGSPKSFSIKLDRTARGALWMAIAAAFVAALLPLFRGVAVAMIASAIIAMAARRIAGLRTRITIPPFVIMAALLAVLFASILFLRGSSLISSRLGDPKNIIGRVGTWSDAANAMVKNPLGGVGLENYSAYWQTNHNPDVDTVASAFGMRAADSPHSNLLWIGAEMGLPALFIYVAAFWLLIRSAWRALKSHRKSGRIAGVVLLALVAAYSIPGLELTSGYYSDLNLYFFFLTGLLMNRCSGESANGEAQQA